MLELNSLKRNKVSLADYDSSLDIRNRMIMADFSALDVEVLEEILYSPLKISAKKLLKTIGCKEEELERTLHYLNKACLLEKKEDLIFVDKDMRKYFEFELKRFDPHFKPDMEFLQGLLRKVPIQVLPTWYSIPRTSNNIFESIVEKYLLSPHIYQRYLSELSFPEATIHSIIHDLFNSSNLRLSSSDVIAKYNLKRVDFEEIMLLLEFNFVACLVFEKQEDHWMESITPFHEWKEYLEFLQKTEAPYIKPTLFQKAVESDFRFIEQMADLLKLSLEHPAKAEWNPMVEKICLLKLGSFIDEKLVVLETGKSWLDLSNENRSLFLYRHPQNRILSLDVPERYVREAEKSIKRVLHGEWVYFDDVAKGAIVPLSEDSVVMLKRVGKQWGYQLPTYGERERQILKATLFEWLYELGIVSTGRALERDCLKVTSFGKFFFSD